MGNFAEKLKKYFESTPKELLDKEWEEMKHLNDIGPDVIEYTERLRNGGHLTAEEELNYQMKYCKRCEFFDGYDICCHKRNWGSIVESNLYNCMRNKLFMAC